MTARVLAGVFAHPDDEALFAGGLLASAARSGARVQLLCLTRGEAGWSRFGERDAALAARRSAELRAAARALGAEPPTLLDFADGRLHETSPQVLRTAISDWLSTRAPQAVVTFGEDGAYGHADHVACARETLAAVRQLDPPTRLLTCAFDPGTFGQVHANLSRFMGKAALPVPAAALGCPASPGQLRLTLDAELVRIKRDAVAAHDSQLPRGELDRMLAPGLLTALCGEERYRTAHGEPLQHGTRGDPFEGLA